MDEYNEKEVRIRNVIDTEQNWLLYNPVLLRGEIGFAIKAGNQIAYKIGDGNTAWVNLPYSINTASEITAMVTNLQNQIDAIVTTSASGGDVAAEVAQSRVGADGTAYQTLKQRLDAEYNALAAEQTNLKEDLSGEIDNIKSAIGMSPANPEWEWDGYYYLMYNTGLLKITKTPISEAAASVQKLTKPIKVNKGDVITVHARMNLNRYVIAFCDEDGTVFTDGVVSTNANLAIDYVVTSNKEQYFVCGNGKNNGSFEEDFKITIKSGDASKITQLNNDVALTKTPEFFSVSNGANLDFGNSILVSNTEKYSIELMLSIEEISTGWLYGGSTSHFGLYANIDGTVRASLNVGNYETVNLYDKSYNGEVIHVVLECDVTTNTKSVYFNGELLGIKTGTSVAVADFADVITKSGITVYQHRLWKRLLSASEVKSLYNNGYPNKLILNNSLRQSIVSEYIAHGISPTAWMDSVKNTSVTLDSNAIVSSNDKANPYSDIQDNKHTLENITGVLTNIIYPDFEIRSVSRGAHDCTFIGEELVSFNKPSDGNANYIDIGNWTRVKTKTISFTEPATNRELEMKSCDYKYGKLLIGNGRAIKYEETDYTEQGARLYVFHEAEDWRDSADSQITLSNCGKYDIIDIAELGYKVYGFWGQTDNQVFVSCNLFNDIYLIQLGTGSEDLGHGTFVSATSDRYNGSFAILNHWHQDNALGEWSAHGGQYYRGCLYLATNNLDECRIYRCILENNGNLRFELLDFNVIQTNGKLYYRYIDGMCIKDNKIYAQPLTVGTSNATNYNDMIVADLT